MAFRNDRTNAVRLAQHANRTTYSKVNTAMATTSVTWYHSSSSGCWYVLTDSRQKVSVDRMMSPITAKEKTRATDDVSGSDSVM